MPGWCMGTANAEMPLCFGTLGIGTRQEQAPLGDIGVARPHFVPVDDVLASVAYRTRAQRREVGAGIGFAEALAPPVAPADQTWEEAVADLLTAMLGDPLDEVAEARLGRRAGRGEFLVDDDLEHRRQLVAAVRASAT